MNGGYERDLVATVFCYKTIIWNDVMNSMQKIF